MVHVSDLKIYNSGHDYLDVTKISLGTFNKRVIILLKYRMNRKDLQDILRDIGKQITITLCSICTLRSSPIMRAFVATLEPMQLSAQNLLGML